MLNRPDNNMYQNGEYLKKKPAWGSEDSEWKARLIDHLMQKNNVKPNNILEVGCGAGGILFHLLPLQKNVTQFDGYDISSHAIEIAKKNETDKLRFFQQDFLLLDKQTDLLLMIDVLEHVDDYLGFLRALQQKGKQFIFHIPLDLSCRTLLKPHVLKQQRDDVGHLHYFSRDMVFWMLKDCGFSIVDWHYTKPITDINKSSSIKQAIKKSLRNISFSINKRLSDKLWGGYSMLILAHGT